MPTPDPSVPSRNINLPGAGNWNLPFDQRITGYGPVGTGVSSGNDVPVNREVSVKRGWIKTDPRMLDALGKEVALRYLYFLYNPATLGLDYSSQADNPSLAALMRRDGGQASPLTGGLSQSLNFALLFDRTFEVMAGDREGVWRDVRTALALTGVMDKVAMSGADIDSAGSDVATGAMIMRAMYFHFGNQAGGLTYYGYISSLGIEYTHFSRDMVPIRCGMRIGVNLLPNDSTTYTPISTTQIPDNVDLSKLKEIGEAPPLPNGPVVNSDPLPGYDSDGFPKRPWGL